MLKCFFAKTDLVDEGENFAYWLTKVNTQRREKVLRCKNVKDKQRSLLAGILLRCALEAENIAYETLDFAFTPEGKPLIISEPSIHFNMSHAGDYACCVISDIPIGVDIESMEKSIFTQEKENRLYSMAEKYLSTEEKRIFENSEKKSKFFLECWTKKEAYSKFTGKGLRTELSSINTVEKQYWTKWITEDYCISIYNENENYEELFIKQIESL